jgi:transmembrane sensor
MTKEEYLALITKIADGIASEEEIAFYNASFNAFQLENESSEEMKPDLILLEKESLNKLQTYVVKRSKPIKLWPQIAVAASILILLSSGIWFLVPRDTKKLITHNQISTPIPGGNKAVLTLASGRQILLTDAKNGTLASQGNTNVTKTADGKVVYQAQSNKEPLSTIVNYNTVSTLKGGQYLVVLPDNTHVWLNASSSIKFPTVFNGNSRQIFLTGEAYFEVTHDPSKPFRVTSAGQMIQVLGTHFNINAYQDEPIIKTTLLQGSVKIVSGKSSGILKPGQQSQVANGSDNNSINVLNDVDTDDVIAWKNGIFSFDDTPIEEVMKEIGRWYDADIIYEGAKPNLNFTGVFPKSSEISKVLETLEGPGGVKFNLDGNKIIVKKN